MGPWEAVEFTGKVQDIRGVCVIYSKTHGCVIANLWFNHGPCTEKDQRLLHAIRLILDQLQAKVEPSNS